MNNIVPQLKILFFGFSLFVTTVLAQSKMYWTEQISIPRIQRANLDGSDVETILTAANGLARPFGVEVDEANGKLYWTDVTSGSINRANMDGSNIENLLTGLSGPRVISLDIAGGKMYWAESNKIYRANLDGSNSEEILDLANSFAWGIDLDLMNGKIYWTLDNRIQMADLDGSNRQIVNSTSVNDAIGIALDVAGGKLYWAEHGGGNDPAIKRSNLDGDTVETIVSNNPNPVLVWPYGITLDLAGGKMYWTDFSSEKIYRANLDGSSIEEVIASGIHEPSHISILQGATDVDEDITSIPNEYLLGQNYPNPFNPTTKISWQLPVSGWQTLKVYDLLGNEVATLVDEYKTAGRYEVEFSANGGSASGGDAYNLSSGIYFYRLRASDFIATKTMVLIR